MTEAAAANVDAGAAGAPTVLEHTNTPAVYIQELCLLHKNIDKTDKRKSVWERPHRLRAVQYGVGAILARLEQTQQRRHPLASQQDGQTPPAPPVRIIRSTASDTELKQNEAAANLLNIKDEDDEDGTLQGWTYARKLQQWCRDSRRKINQGMRELPTTFEADLYREWHTRSSPFSRCLCSLSVSRVLGSVSRCTRDRVRSSRRRRNCQPIISITLCKYPRFCSYTASGAPLCIGTLRPRPCLSLSDPT